MRVERYERVCKEFKAPKSFTLDGKRYKIDPLIPQGLIQGLIAGKHISESDADIEAYIAKGAEGNNDWTPALLKQAQRYALSCHRKNQALYGYVNG